MLATRFICARKSRHVDHRGEIRQRSAAVTFAMVGKIPQREHRSHICNGPHAGFEFHPLRSNLAIHKGFLVIGYVCPSAYQ